MSGPGTVSGGRGSGPGRSISGASGEAPRINRELLAPLGGLVAGAVLQAVAPLAGVVRTANGSPPGVTVLASWAVLIGPLVVLLIAVRRPVAGLAAAASVGVLWSSRLLADLGAVQAPGDTVRPELFYEASVRALPLHAGVGGAVLLGGDLLMIAGGVLAAIRLARAVASDGPGSGPESVWRPAGQSAPAGLTADPGGVPDDRGLGGTVAEDPADDLADATADPVRRADAQVLIGLLGAVGALLGVVGIPYAGGYLDGRALPPSLTLWGLTAGLALAGLAGAAVLIAPALPRDGATALVGGAAAVIALPALTALLVLTGGSGVRLDATLWAGLAGAVLVAMSVPLLRPRSGLPAGSGGFGSNGAGTAAPVGDEPGAPLTPGWPVAGPALLAAALAVLAGRLPGLQLDGRADPPQPSGFPVSAPIGAPFPWAAGLLAAAALFALIPRTAAAARAALTVAWLPAAYGVTSALVVYSTVQASAQTTAGRPGTSDHAWNVGPGLWAGIGAALGGLLAAVVAGSQLRREADAVTTIPDEDQLAGHRTRAGVLAGSSGLAVLAAGFLPMFSTAAGEGVTLTSGLGVDGVGLWLLVLGAAAALLLTARTTDPAVVVGAGVAAAAVGLIRWVIPAAVRAQDGFVRRPGLVVVAVVALLIVLCTLVISRSLTRVTRISVLSAEPGATGKGARSGGAIEGRPAGKARMGGGSGSAAGPGTRSAVPPAPTTLGRSGKAGSRPATRGSSGKGRR